MTETIERIERGTGSRHDERWRVIVLSDSHNTFEGVAFADMGTVGVGERQPDGAAGSGLVSQPGRGVGQQFQHERVGVAEQVDAFRRA